jgi:glyoxylase-like metal-dependent hydrolase (beta-lactamase superfamily II)
MSRNVPPGIYAIRGLIGACHLLVDEGRDAVMLDTGLFGEPVLLRWQLRRLGLPPTAIKAILLSHGHLDHAGNLAWVKRWTGAPIYAHPAEQAHLDGTYRPAGADVWNASAMMFCVTVLLESTGFSQITRCYPCGVDCG